MKALSIYPQYAQQIAVGFKTIECRSWRTNYRGDILVCSSAKKGPGMIPGHALAVVTLADIVPFEHKHLYDARMSNSDYSSGLYAWILENPRLIKPFPVKGKLHLWECDHEIIFLPVLKDRLEATLQRKAYWDPITC